MMIRTLISAGAIGLASATVAAAQDAHHALENPNAALSPATQQSLQNAPDLGGYRTKQTAPTGVVNPTTDSATLYNIDDPSLDRDALDSATTVSTTVNPPAYPVYNGSTTYSDPARTPISSDVAARTGVAIEVVTNGPVPDTVENRQRYGQPMSRAGRMTRPAGN